MTSANTFQTYGVNLNCGGITVTNAGGGNRSTGALYSLISYGPDGHGAYLATGSRFFAGSTDAGQWTNCHCNATADTGYAASYVLKDQTSTFDDIVRFKERWQLMSTADKYQTTGTAAACGSGTCALPWSGTMAQGAAAINAWPSASVISPATCGSAHSVTCPVAPTTLCDGASTLTNCQASGCVANCGLSANEGGGTCANGSTCSGSFYPSNSVASPSTCGSAHVLACTTGTTPSLTCDGSSTLTNCAYNSCVVNCTLTANQGGGTCANNSTCSGSFYPTNSVTSPATCGSAHVLACNASGALTCDGSSTLTNCTYNSCALTCSLTANQGGGTLPGASPGNTTTEYQSTSDATCTAETMTCTNGTLSCSVGNMTTDCQYNSCTVTGPCTPNTNQGGGTLTSGATRTEYQYNSATACTAETMTCTSGTLSCSTGTMSTDCQYSSCTVSGNGFQASGAAAGDQTGNSVAIGDVNGDGYPDLIIGAFAASAGGNSAAGKVYVVFGTAAGLPDPLPLSNLNGTNGFELDGAGASYNAGVSVAAGDVNGDGKADIIIGAFGVSTNKGAAYVVFGGATNADNGAGTAWTSCPCTLNAAFLNGTNGAEFDGTAAFNYTGYSVAAGDVNGDGKADIIIGATRTTVSGHSNAGSVYVVFGKAAGWSGTATTLNATFLNGTNGVQFNGAAANDWVGTSLAAGDVNGDGKADIIIGADGWSSYKGAIYVVFGKAAGWSGTATTLNSTFLNGTNGFELDGSVASGETGFSVAAGDVNGDGKADIIISAPYGTANAVYVVFGKAAGWSGTATALNAAFLNGTNGVQFNGAAAGDVTGYSVTAGDVNGDGKADIIISAPDATVGGQTYAGKVYVVFGKAAGWSGTATTLNPTFLNGTNGVEFDAPATASYYLGGGGWNALAVGDINHDGYGDIAIGSSNPNGAKGSIYVYFGKAAGWPTTPYSLSGL
jgi:hypothetical protein